MRSNTVRCGFSVVLLSLVFGCNQSKQPTTDASPDAAEPKAVADANGCLNPPQDMSGPAGAVYRFLSAFRSGDDATTEAMLTELSRRQIKEHKLSVAPPANDSLQFEIGEVEMLDDQGARVHAKLSDLKDGKPAPDEIIWMLRKEADGWRIAGMAETVFPGEPPVLLDFENLAETLAKRARLKEEIARRNRQDQDSDAPAAEGDAVATDTPPTAGGADSLPAATPDAQQPQAGADGPADAPATQPAAQQAEKPSEGAIR